jgi:hypothetical protein
MDFDQADCNGTAHHLFTELDAGNVVILEFIMLNCAPCIVGTKALESITAPYEETHPGRVHTYSFGFLNSYSCEQLQAWISNNNFTHPVFNNGEEQVNYYGGMGMPTIVVAGTNEHKVFFKSIGYTPAIDGKIRQAIDSALLYNPTGVGEKVSHDSFSIFPTMFADRLNIEISQEISAKELIIYDSSGRTMLVYEVPDSGKMTLSVSGLPKGLYIARLKTGEGLSGGVKLIRR